MNNLSRNRAEAKRAYLKRQQDEMLARYETSSPEERSAVIRHIDALLEVLSEDQREFWETFRGRLLALPPEEVGYGILNAEMVK
ncbi:MAG: hypothetical protein R2747_13510 [Pyrinomonadaceae bacterium]